MVDQQIILEHTLFKYQASADLDRLSEQLDRVLGLESFMQPSPLWRTEGFQALQEFRARQWHDDPAGLLALNKASAEFSNFDYLDELLLDFLHPAGSSTPSPALIALLNDITALLSIDTLHPFEKAIAAIGRALPVPKVGFLQACAIGYAILNTEDIQLPPQIAFEVSLQGIEFPILLDGEPQEMDAAEYFDSAVEALSSATLAAEDALRDAILDLSDTPRGKNALNFWGSQGFDAYFNGNRRLDEAELILYRKILLLGAMEHNANTEDLSALEALQKAELITLQASHGQAEWIPNYSLGKPSGHSGFGN